MGIAITLKKFLRSQKINYDVLEHRYAEGSHDTAQLAEVPAGQLLKGVVFRDEDFFYTMAIVPAHHRVLRHTLNEVLGRHLVLADEEELRRLFFDCEPGAIPSFGQAYGLNIIWDAPSARPTTSGLKPVITSTYSTSTSRISVN